MALPMALERTHHSEAETAESTSHSVDFDETQKLRHPALDLIAETGKSGYAQITLYNSFQKNGNAEEGIEAFNEIHTNLLGLHGFMAGFMFVALDSEHNPEHAKRSEELSQVIFAIRVLGLLLSFCGLVVSLTTIEYLKSLKDERYDLQVKGIMKFHYVFLMSDQLAVGSTVMLLLTVNLLCYGVLPNALCYVVNVASLLGLVFVSFLFKAMILNRQREGRGRRLYNDEVWRAVRKAKGLKDGGWLQENLSGLAQEVGVEVNKSLIQPNAETTTNAVPTTDDVPWETFKDEEGKEYLYRKYSYRRN